MELGKFISWFWETWGVPGLVMLVLAGVAHVVYLLRRMAEDMKTIGKRLDAHELKDEQGMSAVHGRITEVQSAVAGNTAQLELLTTRGVKLQ